jgi:hypothetical protein
MSDRLRGQDDRDHRRQPRHRRCRRSELAGQGATVVPVGRSVHRTSAIAAELGVEPLFADNAKLFDVRRLAEQLLERLPSYRCHRTQRRWLDAGAADHPGGREMTVQTNYLAP